MKEAGHLTAFSSFFCSFFSLLEPGPCSQPVGKSYSPTCASGATFPNRGRVGPQETACRPGGHVKRPWIGGGDGPETNIMSAHRSIWILSTGSS